MILFWELLNVYWTGALRFIGLKQFLKVYSVRRGIKDSVFYLLINRNERWGGGGSRYEDWIHSSRSIIFLTWRYLKIYLRGIVYKTKHLSNGCKQQIDNKYRKKAGQYLYCNVTGVFFKWNTSITIQSRWCLISLLL